MQGRTGVSAIADSWVGKFLFQIKSWLLHALVLIEGTHSD